MDYDVVVVGGSANGAQAARTAASNGAKTLIIEEHGRLGYPEHCSGLFSYTGLEQLDSIPPSSMIFNDHIYGSRLIAPNGKTLTVRKNKKHAMVTDRAKFDQFLIERAKSEGAEILFPFRVREILRDNNSMRVFASNKSGESIEIETKMAIIAEGVRGKLARSLGFKLPEEKSRIFAAQVFMNDLNDIESDLVELYQTQKYAPNFFGWIIPMSESSAKIGLGTSNPHAGKALDKMLAEHPILNQKVKGATTSRKIAGKIPVTGPLKRTYDDNILLVGDVAGQTKPTTGGGVILGGIAAQIAGTVAADAIKQNNPSKAFLHTYEKLWRKELYKNLWYQRKVRNYINNLSDNQMNEFFDRLEQKGLLTAIESYGDVDNQAKLAIKLLRTISLYPYYMKTSLKLLRAIVQK